MSCISGLTSNWRTNLFLDCCGYYNCKLKQYRITGVALFARNMSMLYCFREGDKEDQNYLFTCNTGEMRYISITYLGPGP